AFAHPGTAAAASSAPRRLPLWPGRAAAGHPFRGTVPARHALKVLTGAPMPAGTDTVALQEAVALEGGGEQVLIPAGLRPDANRYILQALLQRLPVRVLDLGVLPDDPAAVRTALEAAGRASDVILSSGGASRGEEDHVVRSVGAMGRLDFWQIAMKPGRPLG